ncbi:MAG: hypothetical protein P1U62_04850 [Alteraurantiacibacter sp. bin_em_oilr2.035]|uniref:hypothetical protein n=1 Tax=Aurantiacibacter atlanticus TaxID=1648404 RepID=UPI00065F5AAF|nr:hypothetical protein [Aurantiacibacter atlanticus]MDF1834196.1 hypothetical protein [Alteraurantiacibacter sp. bin_em_oilr2.035]
MDEKVRTDVGGTPVEAVPSADLFAQRVFLIAGAYGFVAVPIIYFTDAPDPHRLMYFAFAGIALVFQGVFIVISRNPGRYAPLMPLCIFEKLSFGVPAVAFWSRGQAEMNLGLGGIVDLVFAALFFIARRRMTKLA